VLDPELAAVLLAVGLAGALSLPGLWKAARRMERVCATCGRRLTPGRRTCDCE
jgi:hypothetical protein